MPPHAQAVPIIVIAELLQGRLHVIRQAEARQAKVNLARVYALFEQTLRDVRQMTVVSYTPQAEALYQQWRQQCRRLPSHDRRIAAICVAHTARSSRGIGGTLSRCPGCKVEFWD